MLRRIVLAFVVKDPQRPLAATHKQLCLSYSANSTPTTPAAPCFMRGPCDLLEYTCILKLKGLQFSIGPSRLPKGGLGILHSNLGNCDRGELEFDS